MRRVGGRGCLWRRRRRRRLIRRCHGGRRLGPWIRVMLWYGRMGIVLHRGRRSNMRRRRRIWPVLVGHGGAVVMRRQLLWWIVGRVVRVHVSIAHGHALLELRVGIRIVLSPPPHIRWHSLLPCRQMTTVHHAGLGCCSKPTASCVGLELRGSAMRVGGAIAVDEDCDGRQRLSASNAGSIYCLCESDWRTRRITGGWWWWFGAASVA